MYLQIKYIGFDICQLPPTCLLAWVCFMYVRLLRYKIGIQQKINTHFNFVFQEVENRRLRREKEDKEGVPGNRKNKKNNMKEINDYDE